MKAAKPPKSFKLGRTPVYRRKGDPPSITVMVQPEPNYCSKTIEAINLADLLTQARAFGEEFGRACDVSLKCLFGRSFLKTPYRVRCGYENMPEPPK